MNFKKKVLNMLDYTDSRLSIYVNVGVTLLVSLVAKFLGANITIAVLECVTILLTISTIIQIVRKDRSVRMILYYTLGTIIVLFATVMTKYISIYSEAKNTIMLTRCIQITLIVIAVLVDLFGVFFIANKYNERGKKIFSLVSMIYCTLLAVASILIPLYIRF